MGVRQTDCPVLIVRTRLPIQARQLHILLQHPMDAEFLLMLLQGMSLLWFFHDHENIKCNTKPMPDIRYNTRLQCATIQEVRQTLHCLINCHQILWSLLLHPISPNFPGYPVASTINNLPTGCTDFVYSGYFTTNGLCPDPDHTNNVTLTGGGQQYTVQVTRCDDYVRMPDDRLWKQRLCSWESCTGCDWCAYTYLFLLSRGWICKLCTQASLYCQLHWQHSILLNPFAGQNIDFANSSIVTNPSIYTTIAGVDYYVTTINIVYDNPGECDQPYSFATINFTYVNPIPLCETFRSVLGHCLIPIRRIMWIWYQTGATTPTFSSRGHKDIIYFPGCPDVQHPMQVFPRSTNSMWWSWMCYCNSDEHFSDCDSHLGFRWLPRYTFNGAPIKHGVTLMITLTMFPAFNLVYLLVLIILNILSLTMAQCLNWFRLLMYCLLVVSRMMISDGTYSSSPLADCCNPPPWTLQENFCWSDFSFSAIVLNHGGNPLNQSLVINSWSLICEGTCWVRFNWSEKVYGWYAV